MSEQTNYTPITGSGRGITIADKKFTSFSVEEIRDLLEKYRWIAFTENPITKEDVSDHLSKFGRLTDNDRRKNGVLSIDASKGDEGEVLLGKGFLPLHQDGSLMGTNVDLVGIFCISHENVTEGGDTFIVDVEGAVDDIPNEYLDILRERGIEGKPLDSYYMKSGSEWHAIPAFVEVNGKEYLSVGFPSPESEKPSWLLRIPGISDDKFEEIFSCLHKIVMDDKYCYHHSWTDGDLLLFQNHKTLHGRDAFRGERALANIQVLAD